jgi:LysM repeat protein
VTTTPAAASKTRLRVRVALRALLAAGVLVLAACETDTPSAPRSTTTTSTTAAPTTTTTPPMTYVVKRGDTLTSIARIFGLSQQAIIDANQPLNPDRITEGQVLKIPPAPPAAVTITPREAPPGEEFRFSVTGAKAGETVTFEINTPSGGKFTGQPHTASQDGTVSASYDSSGDEPGTYEVVASGDRGTSLRANYRVLG